MRNLVAALTAFAFVAPATAAAQDLAPAVKRKPAAPAAPRPDVAAPASPAPQAPDVATSPEPTGALPVVALPPTPAAPPRAVRTMNERDVQAALGAVAAQGGGNPTLDSGMIKVMSGLVVAGRCSEAASVAAQNGRTALASRAAQLCK
ncbi:MAG TPA: hypothetical protein VE053_10075 [Allosphingosinicella sp.]|nr:hypothetical protein [Allosphingosinicella sp.]